MALFYMHPPPIDMSWLRSCDKFRSVFDQDISRFSEVLAYDVLKQHPLRTYDSSNASLFYIPIWEWTSLRVDRCRNTTHQDRMNHVAAVLRRSPLYSKRARDHFWISSASQASNESTAIRREQGDLINRMYDLKNVLSPTIVGQRKVQYKRKSTIASRVFEIPYGTPPPDSRINGTYFAGSFDVCCTGKQVRCRLAELHKKPRIELYNRPRSGSQTARCGKGIPSCVQPHCEQDMHKYRYCVVPAGDTGVSARLYSAVAASCLPVVIAPIAGAFHEYVDYSKFTTFINVNEFLRHPDVLLRTIDRISESEYASMFHHLRLAQNQILWYSNASGTHVLEGVVQIRDHPTRRVLHDSES